MIPYHALSTCPLPCSEYLLNRLAAEPLSLSPTSIAPLAITSPAPAVSWLSEPLPPACKAGKTPLPDAFKLSSMAVLYLLSFGWGQRYKIKRICFTRNGIIAYRRGRGVFISFLSEHFLNARGRFLVRLPRKGQPSTWPTPPQMKPFDSKGFLCLPM